MDIDTLRHWPWVLTALQVLGLWAAGRGHRVGWLLGGTVQFPWIAYALLTSQVGFIPGCAVSACIQLHSYVAAVAPHGKDEVTPWARTSERARWSSEVGRRVWPSATS
jgi:hypothetical protein